MQGFATILIVAAVSLCCSKYAASYRLLPKNPLSLRSIHKNLYTYQRSSTIMPSSMAISMSDEADVEEVAAEEPATEQKKPTVFVGNLPFGQDEDSILSMLGERMGGQPSLNLVTDMNTGRHRGFGYMEFESEDDATAAIEKLQGLQIDGRDVRVDMAMDRSERQPRQSRVPQENSVFIGNLDFSITSEQVMAMCNDLLGEGVAQNVRLVTDRETGRPRGFGHIDFRSAEDAARAVTELTGVSMLGRDLRVDHARRKDELPARAPRQQASNSIFIGNLAWDIDNDLIEEMLTDVLGEGKYTRVRLALDRETGRSRGFCHVDFDSSEAADRAIVELNGLEVMGRVLRVDTAQRKSGGGGRGGGGGGFRGGAETGSFGAF